MGTFEEALWDIPEDVPAQVEAESREYYKLPPGVYLAVFGRLNPRYKDQNNKGCDSSTPGAVFSHAIIPLWIIEGHGTAEAPNKTTILGKTLKIPDRKAVELYYPLFVSWQPSDQWKNISLFKQFQIDGNKESKVIIPHPTKPSMKTVNFKALPEYYGRIVKFNIVHSAKGNPYIDTKNHTVELTDDDPISIEQMKKFEEAIDIKMKDEREERRNQTNGGGEYKPPQVDDADDNNTDLDNFLNG